MTPDPIRQACERLAVEALPCNQNCQAHFGGVINAQFKHLYDCATEHRHLYDCATEHRKQVADAIEAKVRPLWEALDSCSRRLHGVAVEDAGLISEEHADAMVAEYRAALKKFLKGD